MAGTWGGTAVQQNSIYIRFWPLHHTRATALQPESERSRRKQSRDSGTNDALRYHASKLGRAHSRFERRSSAISAAALMRGISAPQCNVICISPASAVTFRICFAREPSDDPQPILFVFNFIGISFMQISSSSSVQQDEKQVQLNSAETDGQNAWAIDVVF
ncbi:hypothetical protein K432DRAFT_47637 [Lepidopterella palustris CBS 459.81]|uniref:Uncharacterized protein n=1 Tax=Lepidopterella palustris CBS 459.81 TaxID=1314670 RepID=A0A8E2EAI5_9PEZI|nr:hypothetical protein K432DRAFT_47637 [Lepidopterella palustris CBS 459.81]